MKKAAFVFGRFNPPTIGHQKLLTKLKELSSTERMAPFVFLSHTADAKDNPLPWELKTRFFAEMFPDQPLVLNPAVRTIEDAILDMSRQGFNDITLVVGNDRVSHFGWINNYLEDYKIAKFNVVSAGERDPNAQGAIGASASKARELVRTNDYKSFKTLIPASDRTARELFEELTKVLES